MILPADRGRASVLLDRNTYHDKMKMLVQSNLSNTDTEGTEQSVRIREVSVV